MSQSGSLQGGKELACSLKSGLLVKESYGRCPKSPLPDADKT